MEPSEISESQTLVKIFESKLLTEIIVFFHQQPSIIDTSRGIATWINQDVKKIEKALEKLVNLKILVAHRTSSTVGYSYTQDKKVIYKIGRFIKKNKISA